MYIVNSIGAKTELTLDASAQQVIHALLLAVRMNGGVGLVDGDDSYKLESHDWEEKEADAIQKNIKAGDPAKHNLIWSAKDYADLSERFCSDPSATLSSLAEEFGRTPSAIQNQLNRMGLVDRYGQDIAWNRVPRFPRTKAVYGAPCFWIAAMEDGFESIERVTVAVAGTVGIKAA